MTAAAPLSREALADLPGADLVCAGLAALEALAEENRPKDATAALPVEALLVAIGARRLRRAGVVVPRVPSLPVSPELALYRTVAQKHPDENVHSRYNALIRRLVSFERAAQALSARSPKDSAAV